MCSDEMKNVNTTEEDVKDPAKARVEQELEELNEKIIKLTAFLFGKKLVEMKLSNRMINVMREQLGIMQNYARILQDRLAIWGNTDEELYKKERESCCVGY